MRPTHADWVSDTAWPLQRGRAGAYVNFLADEDATRSQEAYPPATWERLVAIKRRAGPTNLFHLNKNVHPFG
jgi:hypothetical protein